MIIDFLVNHPVYVPHVAEMVYKEFVQNKNSKITFDDVVVYFSNNKKNDFPITLIALEEGKCVGTVSMVENDLKTQDTYTPWLASLYTEPEHRSKGIGKQLITEILHVAKDLGYEKIYLRTETAANYYIDRGWSFVESAVDEKGMETDIFKMKLR